MVAQLIVVAVVAVGMPNDVLDASLVEQPVGDGSITTSSRQNHHSDPCVPQERQERGRCSRVSKYCPHRRGHRTSPLVRPPNPLPHDSRNFGQTRAPGHEPKTGLALAGVTSPALAVSALFNLSSKYNSNAPWPEVNRWCPLANTVFVQHRCWWRRPLPGGFAARRSGHTWLAVHSVLAHELPALFVPWS